MSKKKYTQEIYSAEIDNVTIQTVMFKRRPGVRFPAFFNLRLFQKMYLAYSYPASLMPTLFSKIEIIEINLRTRLSNHICENYGVLGYKNPSIMPSKEYHASLMNDVNREIKRNSRSPFIRNFKDNYENGDIPFYALAETLSFGTLSRFYKNLNTDDKATIADLYNLKYSYLESWIETIAYVRNLCAHYGRLYNVKLLIKIIKWYNYLEIILGGYYYE